MPTAVSPQQVAAALTELWSPLHTGDVVTEKTRTLAEQLRPV